MCGFESPPFPSFVQWLTRPAPPLWDEDLGIGDDMLISLLVYLRQQRLYGILDLHRVFLEEDAEERRRERRYQEYEAALELQRR